MFCTLANLFKNAKSPLRERAFRKNYFKTLLFQRGQKRNRNKTDHHACGVSKVDAHSRHEDSENVARHFSGAQNKAGEHQNEDRTDQRVDFTPAEEGSNPVDDANHSEEMNHRG